MTDDENIMEVKYTTTDILEAIRNNTAFNLTTMISDLQNKMNIALLYEKKRFDVFFQIITRFIKNDTKVSVNNNLSRLYYAFHTELMSCGTEFYVSTINLIYTQLLGICPNSTNLIFLSSPFVKATYDLFENYNNNKKIYCMYGYVRLYDKFKSLMENNIAADNEWVKDMAQQIISSIGKESSEVYSVLYKYIPEVQFKNYCLELCEFFEKDCPEEPAYGDEIGIYIPNIIPFSPEMRKVEYLLTLLRNRGYLLYLIHNTGNATYVLPTVFADEITIPEYFNYTMAGRLVKTRFRYVFYAHDGVWTTFMKNINMGIQGVLPFTDISTVSHIEPMPFPNTTKVKRNDCEYLFLPEYSDVLVNNANLLYSLNNYNQSNQLTQKLLNPLFIIYGSSIFHNSSLVASGNINKDLLIVYTDIFAMREYYRLADKIIITSMTEKNKPYIIDAIALNIPVFYLDTNELDEDLTKSINFVSTSREASVKLVDDSFYNWCDTIRLEDRNPEKTILYTPQYIEIANK